VNTQSRDDIVRQAREFCPDFVHVCYDEFVDVMDKLECPRAITTHFAYITQPERHAGYRRYFDELVRSREHIFVLTERIAHAYIEYGVDPSRLHRVPNGVNAGAFRIFPKAEYVGRSICLGKIEPRKRQCYCQNLANVDFAGPIEDRMFVPNGTYLGVVTREWLYENLGRYESLLLLSDGEASPLVTLEAMAAGLGLILSEYAVGDLDVGRYPWVAVVPEEHLGDLEHIENARAHVHKSIKREDVCSVAAQYDWEEIVQRNYLPAIREVRRQHAGT
jgi:glycosyltransferase involved in cell wall biosynthesis